MKRPEMKEELILITSESIDELSTLEATGLYHHRWKVEMFFRWLKCLVPCRHWFAESREGVLIQIYLCLIKGLLLAELTGCKPNKRMMELLQWHQMGETSDAKLAVRLAVAMAEAVVEVVADAPLFVFGCSEDLQFEALLVGLVGGVSVDFLPGQQRSGGPAKPFPGAVLAQVAVLKDNVVVPVWR